MTSNSLNIGLNNNVGPTAKVYCLQELLDIEQMTISYFIICILNNHPVFPMIQKVYHQQSKFIKGSLTNELNTNTTRFMFNKNNLYLTVHVFIDWYNI